MSEGLNAARMRAEADELRSEARARAEALVAGEDARAKELISEAERLEAEQEQREREHRYLVAVAERRVALARRVSEWDQARGGVEVAMVERDQARAVVERAEREAAGARTELQRLADTSDDLDALRAQRIAVAAAEDAPRLKAPTLERAEVAVRSAEQAVEHARVAVQRAWDELGSLGADAREGVERPECIPKTPTPSLREQEDALLELLDYKVRRMQRSRPRSVLVPPGVDPYVAARAIYELG